MRKSLLLAALLIAGCARVDANTDSPVPQPGIQPLESPAAKAVSIDDKTDLLAFHLGWPAEVSAIPVLAEAIRQPVLAHKAELLDTAAGDKQHRAKQDFPFHQYEFSSDYKVAGDTARLLSLTDDWFEFTGGAHPMHGTKALLWDRETGRPIAFADLLESGSPEALFGMSYCAALEKARVVKRGPDASGDTTRVDAFYQCPKFGELALIPIGVAGQPMTGVRVHADPYVAGPYAEGDYDIDLPLTAAFIAALKPEFRASFAAAQRQ